MAGLRRVGDQPRRVDLFRRGKFVIEAKQFTAKVRATRAWQLGMQEALGQALAYARTLPEPPVLVMACDVGYCVEITARARTTCAGCAAA